MLIGYKINANTFCVKADIFKTASPDIFDFLSASVLRNGKILEH